MENKDLEIEIQEEGFETSASIQLPTNFLAFGEIEKDDVKVYIKQDVYKALEKFAALDTSKEVGSIIIGDYCQELGKTHVIISEYIEAKYTDASASTLTFTHETWGYIHSQHERLYPKKKIIGWQHTHPNYGIFLSNYDLFIQENFFNLPFQVAYVIDPIQNLRGFFQWKNGKIEKIKGYYIYDDIGKPIKIAKAAEKQVEHTPVRSSKAIAVVSTFFCVVTILLLGFLLSLNQKYNEQLRKQEEIIGQLTEQGHIISNQSDTISKLQEELENNAIGSGEMDLKEYNPFVESEDKKNDEVRLIIHTVVEGETLEKICELQGIDYKENIRFILRINGIKDKNLIYTGEKLILPHGER